MTLKNKQEAVKELVRLTDEILDDFEEAHWDIEGKFPDKETATFVNEVRTKYDKFHNDLRTAVGLQIK